MKYNFIIAKLLILVCSTSVFSQEFNPITTALPFLQVSADARAGGLADQGVATSPDVYSQQWNAAKYAFSDREFGVGVNVTPYLTRLVDDIVLANLVGYKKLDDRSAVAVGFRYFSLGEIIFRQNREEQGFVQKPNSLSLDVSYSLKLNDHFSMAVAGRYLRSDLRLQTQEGADANAGNGFGVDITGYYQSDLIPYENFDGRWRGGFAITNIGPKISFSEGEESFIPTNLRVGGGFDFGIDSFNTIKATVEFSKLLVPTPPISIDANNDGQISGSDEVANFQEFNDQSAFAGIFNSFSDAPGGGSEELDEITYSISAEYDYNNIFALRAGYFNESETKGARKFVALGAGFKYTSIGLDLSYLFNTSNVPSPLEGTLRFGLTFNFGEEYTN